MVSLDVQLLVVCRFRYNEANILGGLVLERRTVLLKGLIDVDCACELWVSFLNIFGKGQIWVNRWRSRSGFFPADTLVRQILSNWARFFVWSELRTANRSFSTWFYARFWGRWGILRVGQWNVFDHVAMTLISLISRILISIWWSQNRWSKSKKNLHQDGLGLPKYQLDLQK